MARSLYLYDTETINYGGQSFVIKMPPLFILKDKIIQFLDNIISKSDLFYNILRKNGFN